MKKHLLAFVDIETTGLDPTLHEVFEIGIVFAEQHATLDGKVTLVLTREESLLLRPEHIELADPKALEISKYHARNWENSLSQKEGLEAAASLLDGTIFVAQNVTFDWSFLFCNGKKYAVNFEQSLYYQKLDLASMVFGKYYADPKFFKFTLSELTASFQILNQHPHTALSDARAAFEIAKKVLEAP